MVHKSQTLLQKIQMKLRLNVSQQIVASTKEHVFMVITLCRFPQRQKRLRNRFNVSKSLKQLKITLYIKIAGKRVTGKLIDKYIKNDREHHNHLWNVF